MVERPIPQDILKYKQKAIKNFSAREVVFGAISIGIIVLNISKFNFISNTSIRALLAALPAIPFLLIGFYKPYGVPFEKIIGPLIYDNFLCPQKRLKEFHYKELESYEKERPWTINEVNPKKKEKLLKAKCKPSKTLKSIK